MTTLNDGAARAALAVGVSAATDVTGFGLLGHLGNILRGQRGGRRDRVRRAPGAGARAQPRRPGHRAGRHQPQFRGGRGGRVGRRPLGRPTACSGRRPDLRRALLAVPPENEAALLEALRAEGTPAAAVIGRLTDGPRRAGSASVATAVAFRLPWHPSAGPPTAWISWSTPPVTACRVTLTRRGTEYVVVALRVTHRGPARRPGRPPADDRRGDHLPPGRDRQLPGGRVTAGTAVVHLDESCLGNGREGDNPGGGGGLIEAAPATGGSIAGTSTSIPRRPPTIAWR